jgi:hypothetical protein
MPLRVLPRAMLCEISHALPLSGKDHAKGLNVN